MEKNENSMTYIRRRLINLVSLKDKDLLQNKASTWKDKANIKEATTPTENDFRTQVSVSVKMQKDAELLSAQPEWNFIPTNKEGRTNRKIAKHAWNYHWLISNTDEAISSVIQSATTYWTGVLYEWIKHIRSTIKSPVYIKDENGDPTWIDFKEDRKLTYSWIWTESIPFQNFFINGTNIKNSTEVIVVRYFDKDEYMKEKLEDPSFSNVKKIKNSQASFHIVNWTVWNEFDKTTMLNTVIELEYWNGAKDEYIVEANGTEIKNTPIPYKHKMLPFSLYIDNKADDRIWWIGEFELLEQEERYKNELRTLLVRWVKSAIWLILKDRNADMDEDTMEFGIGEVYETDDVNWIKQFAPNVPIGAISEAETKVDNDIIVKSGINFKNQLLQPNETAARTTGKTKSAQKRINKNIKDNAYSFYRRMAEIRISNIQFLHSLWNKEIPIEWGSIDANGVFTSEAGWYGNAILTKDLLKGEYIILPIIETMLWDNKTNRREEAIRYSQLVGNLQEQDGSRPVKATQLAKLITDEFDYDFEKLTEISTDGKTPSQILKDANHQSEWTAWTTADPNYVPPNQRSQAWWVPTLSGVQTLPNNWN